MCMVHRIVAEVFLPNPNNYPVVNHVDGNKKNPDISNLEWTTFSGNSKHAFDIGLSKISDKCKKAVSKIAAENGRKTTSKPVLQFDLKNNFINKFPSSREAERLTGIPHNNITAVCKKQRVKAKGYIWKYAEDF